VQSTRKIDKRTKKCNHQKHSFVSQDVTTEFVSVYQARPGVRLSPKLIGFIIKGIRN